MSELEVKTPVRGDFTVLAVQVEPMVFYYYRPDGTSRYLRPDAVSFYLRP